MGNILSTMESVDSRPDLNIVDSVSTSILNTSDTSNTSLREIDIVTADDLDFTAASIILNANMKYLSENTKNGTDKSEALVAKITKEIQPDVAISKRKRITNIEMEDEEMAIHEVCAFYLNIARVLVAISLAIYPEGDKETIPGDTDDILSSDFSMSQISFCGSRIQKFAKTLKSIDETPDSEFQLNTNVDNVTTLGNHFGIPELYDLYFDTDYDADSGSFLGMSEDTKRIFEHDLKRFYEAFTGETSVPEHIKRFSDIPIYEKNKSKNETIPQKPLFICKFDSSDEVVCDSLSTSISDDNDDINNKLKDKILSEFAEHLQKMISTVLANQHSLISLVNQMFVFGTQTIDGEQKRLPRVRAYLTENDLAKITSEAQQLITNMTLQCEVDTKLGNEMFVALHTLQTLESSKKQIQDLENKLDILLYA